MVAFYLILLAVVSYFIGAIPIGAVVAAVRKIDIAKHGSGKTGTTNVLRTVGRRAAIMVLVGDILKGVIAVALARLAAPLFLSGDARVEIGGFTASLVTVGALVATAAVVAGHVWSIYLRIVYGAWHGGRGVATALGALLVVNPWIVVLALVLGVPTILISRYVSLGSIVGAAASAVATVVLVIFGQMDVLSLLFIGVAIFIIVAHRDNIERLLKGTERKLGERAKA